MALAERTARALDASGAAGGGAGARRPGPERVRPALLAPRLRLPRHAQGRPVWRVVAQAQPVRHRRRPRSTARAWASSSSTTCIDYEAGIRRARSPTCRRSCCRCCATTQRLAQLAHAAPTAWWPTRGRRPTSSRNQWAIETLAMRRGAGRQQPRERAQAWLQLQGYEPTTLHLGPLTRLGARVHGRQHRLRRPSEREALHATASKPSPSTRCSRGCKRSGLGGPARRCDDRYSRAHNATAHFAGRRSPCERDRRTRTSSRCSRSAASRPSSGRSSSAPATTTCSSSRSP